MIFYIIIFLLSAGGIVAILIRNRQEFAEFNFATFMEGVEDEAVREWQNWIKPKSLLFLEKRLRVVRIWALKAENKLLRASRRLRGIYENTNGGNGNGEHSNSDNSDTTK